MPSNFSFGQIASSGQNQKVLTSTVSRDRGFPTLLELNGRSFSPPGLGSPSDGHSQCLHRLGSAASRPQTNLSQSNFRIRPHRHHFRSGCHPSTMTCPIHLVAQLFTAARWSGCRSQALSHVGSEGTCPSCGGSGLLAESSQDSYGGVCVYF